MTSFWCLYCKLKTYLSPSSSVSVDFEEINVSWECRTTLCPHKANFFPQKTLPHGEHHTFLSDCDYF